MSTKGVILTYSLSITDDKTKTTGSVFTGCGFNFCGRWVLSHGNLFSPLKIVKDVLEDPAHSPKFKTNRQYKAFPDIYVTLEDGTDVKNFINNITVKKGRVVYMWQCPLLKHAIDKIMSSWTLGNKDENIEKQDDSAKSLFSVLTLIDIGANKTSKADIEKCLFELYQLTAKNPPIRGQELQLESTPFGNEVFINTKTNGVICNCVGLENCVVLCDASSTLRCEGGPAFMLHDGVLFGMIVNSLSWWRGEWVGLTLIACLAPILHHHLFTEKYDSSLNLYTSPTYLGISNLLDVVDSTIVQIECGPSWGSGIALSNGFILTCSHVVKNNNLYDVIVYYNGHKSKANVLFKSSDHKAYDLSLLRLLSKNTFLRLARFASTPAIKGEVVVAVGYPYFSQSVVKDLKPTITRGQINNVTPYSIQTSCSVQSGCSGGAIMRFYKEIGSEIILCEVLGVIVCNAKDENLNVSYPNVNMSIPIHLIRKPLEDYINKRKTLPNFEGDTEISVQSLWKFKLHKSNL
ncbi:peroxisomal leader peptide-processing protease [Arctopsyche grandis]|uniref:peroxisomal leader peptide-processing protease n=1 Tax=Arctopsyche grandis TaxID=121162 RepID=UPI00406DA21B